MCARRFLMIIFWLTLIAVAGAFAMFQFGGRVLIKSATPIGHFAAPPPQGAPDYSSDASWLARPSMQDDPSRWLPDGIAPATGGDASVFYIHPTTYLERDRWNAPLTGNADSDFRTRLFVQTQASALAGAGKVWAPRYRQAAFGAFLLKSDDAQQALGLAYSDVRAAFDAFLAEQPKDRPIILAGHSQGALHLMRLLAERHSQLKKRLVAAYLVGWPISTTSDLPALDFPACTAPDQTGCILSWMSFSEPANPSLMLDQWEKTKGLNGGDRRQRDIVCVNPITGMAGGTAPPQANPGTLVPSGDLKSAVLDPGTVGAQCDKGLLILTGQLPQLGPFMLPGNNYHVYDYALFWGAIRADAERRIHAWSL
jgi:hypothetical protein